MMERKLIRLTVSALSFSIPCVSILFFLPSHIDESWLCFSARIRVPFVFTVSPYCCVTLISITACGYVFLLSPRFIIKVLLFWLLASPLSYCLTGGVSSHTILHLLLCRGLCAEAYLSPWAVLCQLLGAEIDSVMFPLWKMTPWHHPSKFSRFSSGAEPGSYGDGAQPAQDVQVSHRYTLLFRIVYSVSLCSVLSSDYRELCDTWFAYTFHHLVTHQKDGMSSVSLLKLFRPDSLVPTSTQLTRIVYVTRLLYIYSTVWSSERIVLCR